MLFSVTFHIPYTLDNAVCGKIKAPVYEMVQVFGNKLQIRLHLVVAGLEAAQFCMEKANILGHAVP